MSSLERAPAFRAELRKLGIVGQPGGALLDWGAVVTVRKRHSRVTTKTQPSKDVQAEHDGTLRLFARSKDSIAGAKV